MFGVAPPDPEPDAPVEVEVDVLGPGVAPLGCAGQYDTYIGIPFGGTEDIGWTVAAVAPVAPVPVPGAVGGA